MPATKPLHRLPEFLIIGAQKAGTTSLYEYLVDNPAIRPASQKELHYFTSNWSNGAGWYRRQFPIRRRRTLSGEATPWMLFHPLAPGRVSEVMGDCRFIVLVRNPVDRAYSHYWHERRRGTEVLKTFEEAIDAEPDRLRDPDERIQQQFSYLARGRYAEQLERWFDHFRRESFLVLDSADLFARPVETTARVETWFGVDPFEPTNIRPRNTGAARPPLSQATRQGLEDYYKEHNERLFALLDRRFDW
ncbi:MAG: sulfotransferase domain-containing protein [Nitrososphaerales archaeon]